MAQDHETTETPEVEFDGLADLRGSLEVAWREIAARRAAERGGE